METSKAVEEKQYPYPSNVYVPNFVTVKLSGAKNYNLWRTQMTCLIESHDMSGFIDGKFEKPSNEDSNYQLWRRSNTLLRGWILGSLDNDVLASVMDLDTAKDVWDKLYTDSNQVHDIRKALEAEVIAVKDSPERPEMDIKSEYLPLYEAILQGNWQKIKQFIDDREHDVGSRDAAVTESISRSGGFTALHIAVSLKRKGKNHIDVVQKLVDLIEPPERLKEMITIARQITPLHQAASVGNLDAVKILVSRYPDLVYIEDFHGASPLETAIRYRQRDTASFLFISSCHDSALFHNLFVSSSLLVITTAAGYFDIALNVVERYPKLAILPTDSGMSALMAITGIAEAFPSGTKFNLLERLIYSYIPIKLSYNSRNTHQDDIEKQSPKLSRNSIVSVLQNWHFKFWKVAGLLVPQIKKIQQTRLVHHQALELVKNLCRNIKDLNTKSGTNSYANHFIRPCSNAMINGTAYEVVQEIVKLFPSVIWHCNEEGYNMIQLAIKHRNIKAYNLLLRQCSEHEIIRRTMADFSKNNILHLAGRLPSPHALNLVSGAALQMQRELQWFEEVKMLVFPGYEWERNISEDTPKMVFSKEHMDLVKQGEEWMRKTAESYTITAALITTIVFAAAITVPGGNDDESGKPNFTKEIAFIIFAVADAISLFSSTTSLLMFLSILTARFAEHDFLHTLPKRLIYGLAALFLSTTSMMIAFSATLYLLFGQKNGWILVTIATSACLPITSFATLQFPLLVDLISSTYGSGTFRKKEK